MTKISKMVHIAAILALIGTGVTAHIANANHSWGGYHWARTANPFTLQLGDNVNSIWDPYLREASSDWSVSPVLDTVVVAGLSKGNCSPTLGRIEVCNKTYGKTGWLGIAQVWANGTHITQGVAKMNDTYFSSAPYNTPAWRRLVMCQEIAHAFGLDHQDENFSNTNLGTCMDYTNNPAGPLSNEHPNAHDYEQLETIYTHLDSNSTIFASISNREKVQANLDNPSEWGRSVHTDGAGKSDLFERDLGHGKKVFTFVYWDNEQVK